ncbi:DUF1007 family protein [Telmatospirillum siberiense]|uniref:DUF1007 domain-containing protein n=1 Tax=Telmatospirillum siberiense TaxID=382514 RepID=A0A2N3PT28_9PROT|nr:DUF1007 family protein [Telmatospirillum siberiense]PKU23559.1 hypothetical protein CWS72_15955 [Telmatospirillum siberiense]
MFLPRASAMLALPLCLFAGSAWSHPHVWVDYGLTALFERGRVVALRQEWSFDEDFSASVLSDVAKHHGKGAFSPAEIAALKKSAFSNLRNYDYFNHVWLGDKPLSVDKEVRDFDAGLEGDRLIYRFTVVLSQPADPRAAPIHIGIWDDSYYVDVGPAKGHPPRLEGAGSEGCRARVGEDKAHPIYFGSVFPPSVQISC